MDIRTAKEQDISDIMYLIGECIKDMESQGIYQWGDFYPDQDVIKDDVQRGSMYIMKNKQDCLGIIIFDDDEEPECKEIKWLSEGSHVLVVHRLAVHPKWQRQGIARKLMDFTEQFAFENKYTSIRLNAYSGNRRAIKFYEQRDYQRTGEVYFPTRELAFYCYEKVLKD